MMDINSLILSVSGDISAKDVQCKIEALEREWMKEPQVDIPTVGRHAGGIYAREIIIPAGTALTGRIYRDDHFDVMVYGDVTVSSDDGIKRLEGFHIFKGNKGKKRAGYTHKETKWITFCVSSEMSDDECLDALTCSSFAQLETTLTLSDYIEEPEIVSAYQEQPVMVDYQSFRIGYLTAKNKKSKLDTDMADYFAVLKEYGFTEKLVREQSEFAGDQIALDVDYGVTVGESIIEGKGLYSDKSFISGSVIMPARIDGKRTIAGRYVNHSFAPNAIMKRDGNNINLVALKDIGTQEITVDYRDSLNTQIGEVA